MHLIVAKWQISSIATNICTQQQVPRILAQSVGEELGLQIPLECLPDGNHLYFRRNLIPGNMTENVNACFWDPNRWQFLGLE